MKKAMNFSLFLIFLAACFGLTSKVSAQGSSFSGYRCTHSSINRITTWPHPTLRAARAEGVRMCVGHRVYSQEECRTTIVKCHYVKNGKVVWSE